MRIETSQGACQEEVRGPVLSMRDRAPWLPALEALEPPGRTAGPVQILTDKSAVPHKARGLRDPWGGCGGFGLGQALAFKRKLELCLFFGCGG